MGISLQKDPARAPYLSWARFPTTQRLLWLRVRLSLKSSRSRQEIRDFREMWDTTNFDVRGQWPAESRRLAAEFSRTQEVTWNCLHGWVGESSELLSALNRRQVSAWHTLSWQRSIRYAA